MLVNGGTIGTNGIGGGLTKVVVVGSGLGAATKFGEDVIVVGPVADRLGASDPLVVAILIGILCRYPKPIPHPKLPSPPHLVLGMITTSLHLSSSTL